MSIESDWIARAETDADIPAIRTINLAAFETAEEADLVDALRADPAWIDGLSIISAGPDGKPTGYALLTRCHVDDTPALCLGPCAVLPEYQGTGVRYATPFGI
ncbi:GNAT family N-acetyltransferase [Mycolicibacterium setense]|uniref:GNAT family N-acetyltransferase n=1 Tax=Mycolicibacterium setense TaxID=431269 RepID=UPI000A8D38BC